MDQSGLIVRVACLALLGLCACGQDNAAAVTKAASLSPRQSSDARPNPDPPSAPAAKPLSENDRLMLESAAKACQSPGADGYATFFEAFARSDAVRKKYAASTANLIQSDPETGRQTQRRVDGLAYVDGRAYWEFPIQIVDYDYKPAQPLRPGDEDEYVKLEINQSQSNQISVEWTRVRYGGLSDGGDDLGAAFDLHGRPYDPARRTDGQLLFEPGDMCWALVADIRHSHASKRQ